MSSGSAEAKQLGEEIVNFLGGDTATVRGSVHTKLTGGKAVYLPIVWASRCSKDIISEQIVRALGVNVSELDRHLRIITASGDNLDILGTCNICIKTQVTGQGGKTLEGNKAEREVLVSLKNMNKTRTV